MYVACSDPSIIALTTIVGTLAVREQSFMYMILYGQGSREQETYLPTSDNQVKMSQAEFQHISIKSIYVSCGVGCVERRWPSFKCGRSSFDVGIREADI